MKKLNTGTGRLHIAGVFSEILSADLKQQVNPVKAMKKRFSSITLICMLSFSALFSFAQTQTFNYTGALQTFTVPAGVTSISINSYGAQGGHGGGLGAQVIGTVNVVPGELLSVLVGGQGGLASNGNGGGGGGTYVWKNSGNILLTAAGGGGGTSINSNSSLGGPGSATVTPSLSVFGSGNSAGGTGGAGGAGGVGFDGGAGYKAGGGGGAGWLTNGGNGAYTYGATGGMSPLNGGAGGSGFNICESINVFGGFGGGGGAGGCSGASGGGGGYNGGGGGNTWNGSTWGSGGGGGSYNMGTAQTNNAGVRNGNGLVTITIAATCTTPTISCPSNISVNNTTGLCGATVNYPAPTVTGTPTPEITYSHASGSFFPAGTTIVTLTATNTCGTVNCTFTVTVTDNQVPDVVTQNVTVYLDANGSATLAAAQVNNGSTDNCGIAGMALSRTAFNCADLNSVGNCDLDANYIANATNANSGPNGQTFTALSSGFLSKIDVISANQVQLRLRTFVSEDLATAFTGSILATSNVVNGVYPGFTSYTFATPALVVAGTKYIFEVISSGGLAYHKIPGTYTGGTAVSPTNPGFDRDLPFKTYICAPGVPVILTVTDVNGNTNTGNAVVTVKDNIAPTITCPADINVPCATAVPGADIESVTTGDNCNGMITVTHEGDVISNQTCVNRYTITRTYKATDASGNSTTCTQIITVNDDTAPVITCPANIIASNTTGQCGAIVNFNAAATDNCGGSPVITYVPASGSFFNIGTSNVTVTATDACGNVSTCSFSVTVNDAEAPSITCPSNITVNNAPGTCGAVVNYSMPTASDNCTPSPGTTSFNFTGSLQSFTVPQGVTSINIRAYGARGGTNTNDANSCGQLGGLGGYATGNLAVVPGEVLNIFVGGRGLAGNAGGFNGGGSACSNTATCAKGGGASDIRQGGTALTNRKIVAAGGGGAEYSACNGTGGHGGGLTGNNGSEGGDQPRNGKGATQLAGGAGGTGSYNGSAGIFGEGGASGNHPNGHAGSGGGGWYGGGGSAADGHAGGGSSYIGGVTGGSTTSGLNAGDGQIIISWTGGLVITQTAGLPSGSTFPVGTTTNTFVAADAAGNESTCSFTVIVTDNQAPVISCPANISVNATSAAGAVVNYATPVGTDNCSATTTRTAGLASGSTFPIGTTTVTHQVTDGSGLTAQCSFTVTVTGLAPQIVCPEAITVNNTTGQCGAMVNFAATETVGIPASVITYSQNPGTFFPVGTTTVTATATNAVGTSSCTFTVTVIDNELPTITCPQPITVNNDEGICGALVNYTLPVVTDNCGLAVNNGSQTFNYSGSIQTFTVPAGITSLKITTKGAQGGNVTVACNATGGKGATMTGDFAVTPGELLTILVGQQGQINANGSDAGGGGGTYVVRQGNIPMIIAGGGGGATNSFGNCGPLQNGIDAVTVTSGTNGANGEGAGGINGNGGTAISSNGGAGAGFYTNGTGVNSPAQGKSYLNGGAGGQSPGWSAGGFGGGGGGWCCGGNGGGGGGYSGGGTSGSFPYTGGGGGGSYNAGSNQINAVNNTGDGQAMISWNSSPVVQTAGLPSGSIFPVGVTTNTFIVTDASGNTSTCSFTITVTDNELPSITCAPNQIQTADAGVCNANVIVVSPVTGDNCGVLSVTNNRTNTSNASGNYPVGTTTLIWTVTDIHNNVSTCTQTITVTDNEAPVITCPADITVNCQDDNSSVATGTATATDNCTPVANIVITQTQTSTYNADPSNVLHYNYVITRTWKATDIANNFSECVQTITVQDVTSPVITCPSNITVNNDAGICGAIVNFAATATDNCSPVTITYSKDPGTVFNVGTTNVTATATDVTGNSIDCGFTVTVNDTENPIITCPVATTATRSTNPGLCTYQVQGAEFNASATDNCGVISLTYSLSGATTGTGTDLSNVLFTRGTTLVTWTATDASNNTIGCSFTVEIIDDQNPTGYIIYATAEAKFGENNYIGGDVGVTAVKGKAEFKKYDVLDPFTVTAMNINVQLPSAVTNQVHSPATGGPNPDFLVYVATPLSGSHTQSTSGTVPAGNFKSLTIKQGITATINGTDYGKITIEEGASVTFTSAVMNIEELKVGKGKKGIATTNVYFAGPASVKIKDRVTIEEDCRINVGGPKVTFYLGDAKKDEENFVVKGDDTEVTLNIMIPNGKLRVSGGVNNCIMTGWFIIEKLESDGKFVYWNKYDCANPAPPISFVNAVEEIITPAVVISPAPAATKDIFSVQVFPNPSTTDFVIQVNRKSSEPVTVRILDMNGKQRSVQTQLSKTNNMRVGANLTGGTYIAEVIQGTNRQTVKLVKLN